MNFTHFDTVKITPFAHRVLDEFLPNLSPNQCFHCLLLEWTIFTPKEIPPMSRFYDSIVVYLVFRSPLGPFLQRYTQRLSRASLPHPRAGNLHPVGGLPRPPTPIYMFPHPRPAASFSI